MDNIKYGLSMKEAYKKFLVGKDYEYYREFEPEHHSLESLLNKLYKWSYRLFALLLILSLFRFYFLSILIVSLLWYKPLCHFIHLKARVNRLNIELFSQEQGILSE